MKYEIGDRVAVYGYTYEGYMPLGTRGIIAQTAGPNGIVQVKLDKTTYVSVHEKQCRKLVRRKSK